MRIISYNVNGIRAAIKKGFFDWLKTNQVGVCFAAASFFLRQASNVLFIVPR